MNQPKIVTLPNFRLRVALALDTGTKLKKVMLKRGLRRARCACPAEGCAGIIHGQLAGKKDHLHFSCDACNLMMME